MGNPAAELRRCSAASGFLASTVLLDSVVDSAIGSLLAGVGPAPHTPACPSGPGYYAGDLVERRRALGRRGVVYSTSGGVFIRRQDGSPLQVFATDERPGRLVLKSEEGRLYNLDTILKTVVRLWLEQ